MYIARASLLLVAAIAVMILGDSRAGANPDADVAVDDVTVSSPGQGEVDIAFTAEASATLNNAGPAASASVDTEFSLSLPGDCSTGDTNPVTNNTTVPQAQTETALVSWSVTCTDKSTHVFTVDAVATVVGDTDPDTGDNSGVGQSSTDVYENSDLEIISQTAPEPRLRRGTTGVDFAISADHSIRNNGPFDPAGNVVGLLELEVTGPGDCAISPPSFTVVALPLNTPVMQSKSVTANCTASGNHSFTLDSTLLVGSLHVQDPTPGNNTASQQIDVNVLAPITDSDGDGVADDDETACGGDPLDPNVIPERTDDLFFTADEDGDGTNNEPLPPGSEAFDCDGDGWIGDDEQHVFTAANTAQDQDPCGPNAWSPDIVDGAITPNGVDIQDLTDFVSPDRYFNTDIGDWPDQAAARRHDLSPGTDGLGNEINILDLTVAVITEPPMLLGDRVYLSVCPYP